VPFLPGVVNTTDPTYTITGTSITGYAASGVGHICAAVPTFKNLMRFCRNGFKLESKQSSSYIKGSDYDSSGKRSYKSLQDNKNALGPKRGKGGADPFRISTMVGLEEDGRFMELRPVQPRAHSDEEQLSTIGRVVSERELEDSASNKTILSKVVSK
jgi:hypothetical protein